MKLTIKFKYEGKSYSRTASFDEFDELKRVRGNNIYDLIEYDHCWVLVVDLNDKGNHQGEISFHVDEDYNHTYSPILNVIKIWNEDYTDFEEVPFTLTTKY